MIPRIEGIEVSVPDWTDAAARGEHTGVILQVFRHPLMKTRRLSNPMVHIKLNKSGRIIRVPLDDCEVIHGRLR